MNKKIINLKDADLIPRLYDIISTNDTDEKFFIFTKEKDMMFHFLCHITFNCFGIEETNNNKRKLLNMYATNEYDKFSENLYQYYKVFKDKVTIFNVNNCNAVNLKTIYTVICGLCSDNKINVIMHNLIQFSDIFECKKVNDAIFVNTEEMEWK